MKQTSHVGNLEDDDDDKSKSIRIVGTKSEESEDSVSIVDQMKNAMMQELEDFKEELAKNSVSLILISDEKGAKDGREIGESKRNNHITQKRERSKSHKTRERGRAIDNR